MTFLVDTNVISELSRPQPDPRVLEWVGLRSEITISVITLEEIMFGLTAKPNVRVAAWFQQFFEQYCRVLPITPEIARKAGELRGMLRVQGKQRTQADMLIAATAALHQLTLLPISCVNFTSS
jgi:predicted nucleic acid-binding protein